MTQPTQLIVQAAAAPYLRIAEHLAPGWSWARVAKIAFKNDLFFSGRATASLP